MLKNAYFLK